MKRPLLVLEAATALAVLMLAVGATPASAADTTVGTAACVLGMGGHGTVPAGSTITVRYGNAEVNRGMLTDWLGAQTTTLALNGAVPIDVSNLYSAPTQRPRGDFVDWVSSWNYPTGITLASPGDSMTFTVTSALSHLFAEVFNGPLASNWDTSPVRRRFPAPASTSPGLARLLLCD
jgi:hypothetical protein